MRLARLSHPRVTVDTAGLSPAATELANLLAERIRKLPPERVERLLDLLKSAPARRRAAAGARSTHLKLSGAGSTRRSPRTKTRCGHGRS